MIQIEEAVVRQALELRALADKFSEGWHDGIKIDAADIMLLTSVADALEQPAQQCQDCEGMGMRDGVGEQCDKCNGSGEQPAQDTPKIGCVNHDCDACKAQQEPFGYFRYDLRLDAWVQNRAGLTGTPFYTRPQAPLTDEQFRAIKNSLSRQEGWDGDGWDLALKEAIEAAHGIKGEK